MVLNPMGYQVLSDMPGVHAFSAQVSTAVSAVSGGEFVTLGSQSASVTSGASSFSTGDILVTTPASGTNYPVGVATQNAVSGTEATVLTKGVILATAAGGVSPGQLVSCFSNHAVSPVAAGSITEITLNQVVGRALTAAGSEEYCAVKLDL